MPPAIAGPAVARAECLKGSLAHGAGRTLTNRGRFCKRCIWGCSQDSWDNFYRINRPEFYFRAVASVGDQLRQARELQELTIPEVVDQTKMKTDQVQALESGDWSIFAAPVYTRGFVRNYATLLKLDPEALLNDLDVELGQAQPSAAKADGDSPLRAGVIDGLMLHFSGVKWRAVIPIFLIVTMAVGGFFAADYWRDYQSRDHLEGLGSGLNDAPVPGDEDQLPVITNAPPPAAKGS